MRHLPSAILLGLLVLASNVAAQTLIDFGTNSLRTNGAPRTWNNVDPTTMSQTTQLVDVNGFPTGVNLDFTPGRLFDSGNAAGTSSPTPNSPLAQLNYPISAVSDYLYGSSSRLVEFRLQNLDLNAVYDFTICASRMGVNDVRTTEYTFLGTNNSAVILDAANNTSTIATVTGIGPDPAGNITVRIRAATSNTNPSGYFYINAMGVAKRGGSPLPPTLTFSNLSVGLSRVVSKPAAQTPLTVLANRSPPPTIGVTAIDQATNQPPTWLTFPAVVTGGQVFQLGFGGSALTVGTYRATLTATATAYNPATATVTLTVRTGGSLNLLYYGNSFSQGNGTTPAVVERIARDVGLPVPNTVARLVGGRDLQFHLTDPIQAAAITTALPPGEAWDYVIVQGFSTEATETLGNPTLFRANAMAIVANVRAHSPSAKAIMFQTWARAQGHSFYLGPNPTFNGPLDMHSQIERNYTRAVSDLNVAFGAGTARRAACGETAALFNFDPSIYAGDLYHQDSELTLMSAMAIFTAIYRQSIGGFEPAFNTNTPLVQWLNTYRLDDDDWRKYAGVADRVADPSLRHAPGSGEDLLLQSGISGPLDARPVKDVSVGKTLTVEMMSPIGTNGGGTAFIVMSWFPTGSPPTPPIGLPELHIDLNRYLVVAWTPTLAKVSWQLPVNATAPGWSVMFQGAVLKASRKTGRPFTVTDGHEIRMK